MKTFYQPRLLKLILPIAFLASVMSIGCESPQLQPQSAIPTYDPPPPTDPTIRGNKCSTLKPNVLSLASDKEITTTAAYPTFLFFVPTTSARQVQFVLKDSNSQTIYRRTYDLSGQSGILRLALPIDGSVSEVAAGKAYKWEFNLICDPDNRKKDDFAVGKLQRLPLSDASKSQLGQASLREQLLRYRADGFEYDTLVVLDALRRANPKDLAIQSEWETWLERYKLGDLKQLPAIKLK